METEQIIKTLFYIKKQINEQIANKQIYTRLYTDDYTNKTLQ